ncbi:response regulator [bacterium]|nr:response regulator [bacterium]
MVRKVLFVDDDQILQCAIENQLAGFSDSFSLSCAKDGFDALKKLKKTYYSVVIIDLIMPRMDGMSLLSHMMEKYPDVAVIITSEMPTDEMRNLVQHSDISGYFKKPFQADALAQSIMRALQKEADGGVMHKVSPPVFFQLMVMEGKTCTIRVIDKVSQQGGILYFVDGQLLDARIGELNGLDAAYEVFGWDDVTVILHNDCESRENRIDSDLQPIIMKAVGMKDEADECSFPVENIRSFFQEELGDKCDHLEELASAKSIEEVVDVLNKIADLSDFGSLRVAHIDDGKKESKIVLAGQPPTVLSVNSDCPPEKVTQLLRDYE